MLDRVLHTNLGRDVRISEVDHTVRCMATDCRVDSTVLCKLGDAGRISRDSASSTDRIPHCSVYHMFRAGMISYTGPGMADNPPALHDKLIGSDDRI